MDYIMTYEEYKQNLNKGFYTKEGKCPVLEALAIIQGKWKLMIIFELEVYGSMRFNEIKKVLKNITNASLTNALKDLEKQEIIIRKEFEELSPHVEYSLTQKGKDFLPIFYELTMWGFYYIK